MAGVRPPVRPDRPSDRPVDKVAVYLADVVTEDEARKVAADTVQAVSPLKADFVGWLTYPADTYAVPTPNDVYGTGAPDSQHGRPGDLRRARVRARPPAARGGAKRPAWTWTPGTDGIYHVDDIRVAYRDGLSPEAIVIVVWGLVERTPQ